MEWHGADFWSTLVRAPVAGDGPKPERSNLSTWKLEVHGFDHIPTACTTLHIALSFNWFVVRTSV